MNGPMNGARRGFTLWELVLVLTLLSVVTGLALPAFTSFGADHEAQPVDRILRLLRSSRRLAITQGSMVSLVIDPTSHRYRVDTIGAMGGRGTVIDTTLALEAGTTLSADSARVHYLFYPTGAAIADSLRVQTNGSPLVVVVDPWGGEPRADTR